MHFGRSKAGIFDQKPQTRVKKEVIEAHLVIALSLFDRRLSTFWETPSATGPCILAESEENDVFIGSEVLRPWKYAQLVANFRI
jgi:hypothetical protein